MEKNLHIFLAILGMLLCSLPMNAQDPLPAIDVEESAEVFLEAYSDDFQENFFEALKQKGIENYDKAINLFLECKRLDAANRVVDHELAKVYFESNQYPLAEEYALTALASEPQNLWYADTLVEVLQKQGKSAENLKAELPFEDPKFKENLALIYFQKRNYETALTILKEAEQSSFTADLTSKINDSIKKKAARTKSASFSVTKTDSEPNPLERYKTRIDGLMRVDSFPLIQILSGEALENYPSQPYFYYAQGYALNRTGKPREAIETLEAGLDYLIDDVSLANKMYQELSDAYTSVNNAVKANMYLRKIKPGF